MFRRSGSNKSMPKEPEFVAKLASLGFEFINDRFVRIGTTSEFFNYFHSDNERVNILRKEAMHECARIIVLDDVKRFGICQSFLSGPDVSQQRPSEAHVSILTTKVRELAQRKDVLIVVGEQSQDLGIWAWRMTMREAGIRHGTAAGLAGMVQAFGLSQRSDLEEDLEDKIGMTGKFDYINFLDDAEVEEEPTMGLIILNPGQLLYSAEFNRTMTHDSWQARRRANALGYNFEIDEEGNRVPGHATPEEHISTFFDLILPELVREDVRLYLVGIADGADHLLSYLDHRFLTDSPANPIAAQLEAVALMQPTSDPASIRSEALRVFLATNAARAWVLSDQPKGTLVNTPAPFHPPRITVTSPSSASYSAPATPTSPTHDPTSEPALRSPLDEDDMPTPTPENFPTHPLAPKNPPFHHNDDDDADDDDNETETKPQELSDNDTKKPHDDEETDDDNDDDGSYPYHRVPTLCPTFSSGVADVLETLWPRVIGDALTFFADRQQAANQREARTRWREKQEASWWGTTPTGWEGDDGEEEGGSEVSDMTEQMYGS